MNRLKVIIIPVLLILILSIIGMNLDKDDQLKTKNNYPDLPKMLFQIPDYMNQIIIGSDLDDRDYVVNFFASWCGPCLAEHPTLMELKSRGVTIIGINFRDDQENLKKWLQDNGNPFKYIFIDNGDIAFEMGLIGVPETYFVRKNKIVNKIQGPIFGDDIEEYP